MIEFRCECGQPIRVPESLSDMEGACPGCGKPTRVPVAGIEGWSSLIVEGLKNPILALPLMTEHPDIQSRTYLPGYLYFTSWIGLAIGLGTLVRQRSSFLANFGWREDSSDSALWGWVVLTALLCYLSLYLCWVVAGAVYFRFTGQKPEQNRVGFADAGGYDVARWVPFLSLGMMAGVFFLIRRLPGDPVAFLCNPWVFTLALVLLAPALAQMAAYVLFRGRFPDVARVEALLRALKDDESSVRCEAADALGRMGGYRAVRPLMEALSDPNDNVRWAAAHALGRLQNLAAVPALTAVLGDSKESVRREAQLALKTLQASRNRTAAGRSPGAPEIVIPGARACERLRLPPTTGTKTKKE